MLKPFLKPNFYRALDTFCERASQKTANLAVHCFLAPFLPRRKSDFGRTASLGALFAQNLELENA